MSYHLQATFSRGELDPELIYRSDLELFRSSLAECRNFLTLKRGGLRRRGGTKFIAELKDSSRQGWLIPFEFGNGQYYMLEFGDHMFRIFTSEGRVGTVEVATPYSSEVLPRLKFVQSTDTLFIAGGGVAPQALKRLSELSWAIEPMSFRDGPYLDVNISPTNLKPTGTGNAVPKMTSNTAPSGVVSASNGSASAWQVFSRSEGKTVLSSGATGWVQYQFPSSVVIDAYMLQAPNDNSQNDDMPWQWNIEASNNGSDWTILDTQDGQDTWASNEWREYDFHNETAFTHYRLSFTQGGGSASDNSAIGQLVFHQAGNDQSPFTLTASGTGGINGGAGFRRLTWGAYPVSRVGRVLALVPDPQPPVGNLGQGAAFWPGAAGHQGTKHLAVGGMVRHDGVAGNDRLAQEQARLCRDQRGTAEDLGKPDGGLHQFFRVPCPEGIRRGDRGHSFRTGEPHPMAGRR